MLPDPVACGVGIFSCQGRPERHPPEACRQVFVVLVFHTRQVLSKRLLKTLRQDGHPVLLSFSIPYPDLMLGEIDVLHS
jgi:hypothetical protein